MALAPLADDQLNVKVSSRKLAEIAGVERRNVQLAIDSLSAKRHLTTRAGTAKAASAYVLNFLKTVPLVRGVVTTPPPQQANLFSGADTTPPWRSSDASTWGFSDATPGVVTTPPPGSFPQEDPRQALPPARARIEFESSIPILDRVLNARPKLFDRARLEEARRFLGSLRAKLGDEGDAVHPPDDHIVAQFLAIADWRDLEKLLYDLMAERRKPGHSYAWFIAVALERIHGIRLQPGELRRRRAELRVVAGTQAPAPPPAPPPPPEQLSLDTGPPPIDIPALAAAKRMR